MMGKWFGITVSAFLVFAGVFAGGTFYAYAESSDVPRMTKEELKPMLGDPNLVIVDVRLGGDWAESDIKIKDAVREDPRNVPSWAEKYPKNKTFVLYCA
jgi:hypothetical protein